MKIVMEKYHGFGNDYLIWDPLKNNMKLDSNRVKAINKSNLGIGSIGILYGPIIEDNNIRFRSYNSNGSEMDINEINTKIFQKYILDSDYQTKDICNISSLEEELSKGIHNVGFIILNNDFVKELQVI